MIRTMAAMLLILLICTPAPGQSDRRQRSSSSDEFTSEYGTLTENNIFLRDRGRRPAPPATRPSAPPLTREQTLILTGIVLEQGQFRAYFEDTRSSSIVRVAEGDSIASGTIGQIMINAVAYETPDGMRWIDIGHDLTASIPVSRATSASSAPPAAMGGSTPPASSGGSAQPAGPTDPALMSVEERMRQRALQQRNR